MTFLATISEERAGFPHQAILQHQLGVLQFNSGQTLSTWREHQIPQAKGLVLREFKCPSQIQVVTYAFDQLSVNWSSSEPFIGFDQFAGVARRAQYDILLSRLPVYYKKI